MSTVTVTGTVTAAKKDTPFESAKVGSSAVSAAPSEAISESSTVS